MKIWTSKLIFYPKGALMIETKVHPCLTTPNICHNYIDNKARTREKKTRIIENRIRYMFDNYDQAHREEYQDQKMNNELNGDL